MGRWSVIESFNNFFDESKDANVTGNGNQERIVIRFKMASHVHGLNDRHVEGYLAREH